YHLLSSCPDPPPPDTYTLSLHDALPIWSRTVSCMIGSMPRSASKCAAAIDDRCTWAPVLSVQLIASATPRSWSPFRPTASGSALSLEASSAVTTNCPERSSSARRLMPDTPRPTLRGTRITTIDQVDPGR